MKITQEMMVPIQDIKVMKGVVEAPLGTKIPTRNLTIMETFQDMMDSTEGLRNLEMIMEIIQETMNRTRDTKII